MNTLARSLSHVVVAARSQGTSFLFVFVVAEELARDFDTNWMTACEMVTRRLAASTCRWFISHERVRTQLADDIFLGAENCFNLFTLYRNVEALAEEDRGA